MINRLEFLPGIAVAGLLLLGTADASVEALRIGWSALRPADQDAGMIASPSNAVTGQTLSRGLEGREIALTGYLLPVDREGDLVYEFMLLPISGLCIHVPPPPPNQAVHVFPAKPYRLREIYETVSVSGTLKPELEKTQLIILDGVSVMETGYRIARAEVAKADSVPDAVVRKGSPWGFLDK